MDHIPSQPPVKSSRGPFTLAAGTAAAAAATNAQAYALGPVAGTFAPWMLLAVPAVVGLWWLMKSIPLKPIRQAFPGISLLFKLESEEKTPKRIPWWQYIPITLASAALVGALTRPELNPQAPLPGSGPVMLVVDNGWAAARQWQARHDQMQQLINRAEREGRPVMILPTAAPDDGSPVKVQGPLSPAEARQIALQMKPLPWPADREGALESLTALQADKPSAIVWLSNGLNDKAARPLSEKLASMGQVTILEDAPADSARLLLPPETGTGKMTVTVKRSHTGTQDDVQIVAVDESGKPIDQATATFKPGASETQASFNLPPEISNELARLSIAGEPSAAATVLLDERWRRRPVGVIANAQNNAAQPLLNESDYIDQALNPYVDLHQGPVDELLKRKLAVLVMTDAAAVGKAQSLKIDQWVQEGGTLLRFAGQRLAAQETLDQSLLPLKLRQGARTLGGNVSGGKEGKLAPFPSTSPFAGIPLASHITIKQEVLPQPGADNDENTWARLQDGTPLVTARKHGKGQIVLFHTTADPAWSNLSLSGTFVDMMRAVVASSQGVAGKLENTDISLPPLKTLDGFGRFGAPGAGARPLTAEALAQNQIGPQHPPGYYGNESLRQALNLSASITTIQPLGAMPDSVLRKTYAIGQKERDLTGALLGGALGFLLLDLLIVLYQRRSHKGPDKTPARKAPKPEAGS
ncbi:MAG: BatA domain-containing protein [Micavibrio aeruginosavorus]|uniref:BatA domain-containing protein n=1 Tax=Micavibrio aeruginosavorus TaxID=349221 RepID=A0A7T5R281_9BACT|nr:MAG: BatA domain-containing protein [Micavibrio aeruginosavorus]